jgi:hypothetical protein
LETVGAFIEPGPNSFRRAFVITSIIALSLPPPPTTSNNSEEDVGEEALDRTVGVEVAGGSDGGTRSKLHVKNHPEARMIEGALSNRRYGIRVAIVRR